MNQKTYTIFALVFGDTVYVGKTTSPRLSEIYRRHRRGAVKKTKMFSAKGVRPTLHILERDDMPAFLAHRWVVAYTHSFLKADFEILNSAETVAQSKHLHPETKKLVDIIANSGLDSILQRSLAKKPTDADFCIPNDPALRPASEKLTIRISKWEKDRLNNFSQKMHMTQRQTLQFLLSYYEQPKSDFPPWEDDVYVRAMLGALREENAKLRKQNENYKNQLSANKNAANDPAKNQLAQLCSGISTFFSMMEPAHPIPLTLERAMYKNYPNTPKYQYPKKAGIYLFRPHAILTGKGRYPAKFILGICNDGSLYKFRYYEKKYFAGIRPGNNTFMLRGSTWIIGCQEANDGSMDLTFAFPLDIQQADPYIQTN